MVLGRTGYSTAVKGTNGFSLFSGTSWAPPPSIRNSGIPKFAVPFALIRRRKKLCAHLPDEDQNCAGGKVET